MDQMMKLLLTSRLSILPLATCLLLPAVPAWTQEVVTLDAVPADMIEADGESVEIDLGAPGERHPSSAATGLEHTDRAASASSMLTGSALRAARSARQGDTVGRTRRPPATGARAAAGIERIVFERQPVEVRLPLDTERLVTLPAPAALHVPSDMAQVARIEAIDRTIYATALVPFTPIRIVAELIDSGQQIPLDLVADESTADALAELEIFVVEPPGSERAASDDEEEASSRTLPSPPQRPQIGLVEMTRHAARQLYAPPRLAWATPGVSQVELDTSPLSGLIRGVDVETVPMGQWRGGDLYVTAVRVTNKSGYPLEIPLEDFRGQWLAATAQHGRIGPAGSEDDTTAVYLVCSKPFMACRR